MRSRRRPPGQKIVAYSRAKRTFSPNNYVIEYENELARFPHNPSSASRHLSRCQRGGLHNVGRDGARSRSDGVSKTRRRIKIWALAQ